MKNYKLLEHTADLGIRVWGTDIKKLFINAAAAMYELIADISNVKEKVSFEVKTQAQDRDELLRNWLSELLYYFHTKDILLSKVLIKGISDNSISSSVYGEPIDTKRHLLRHEIKAVTFHNLKIVEENGIFSTDIIFDV